MLDALQQLDTNWLLWINSHHYPTLDWVMWVLSQYWCIDAIILIAFCITTLRIEPRRWWLMLLAIGLCVLLADQGSVHLFKNTVCRLRPCHALDDLYMFRTSCGGKYGFVSSHAANAFAVLVLLWLRYGKKAKVTMIVLTVWAVVMCYSRAYLGKHYPGDIMCGALFGAVVGLAVWWLAKVIEKKLHKNETK